MARRDGELRKQTCRPIFTNKSSMGLAPGEQALRDKPTERTDVTFARGMSAKLRAEVLGRSGLYCQMCGLSPGHIDPYTGRNAHLHLDLINGENLDRRDELANLRALCTTCKRGAELITSEKPTRIWLLSPIRRGGHDEQRAVFDWLLKKFGGPDR